jgi:hypothetical protein
MTDYLDSDTIGGTTTPISAEVVELVDAATFTNTTTPSSSELHTIFDAATFTNKTTPTFTETEWFHGDLNTTLTKTTPSSEENYWPCPTGYWGPNEILEVLPVEGSEHATIKTRTNLSGIELYNA